MTFIFGTVATRENGSGILMDVTENIAATLCRPASYGRACDQRKGRRKSHDQNRAVAVK